MQVRTLNRVPLLVTPWTAAYQAPSSVGFSRQECWNGVPLSVLKTSYAPGWPHLFGLHTHVTHI